MSTSTDKIAPEQPIERKESKLEDLRRKISKGRQSSKKAEKLVKVITVPESVMLGLNPRTSWPWGFDGCGDGNARFQLPPGFEYDQRLEEIVDELNAVPKVSVALANCATVLGLIILLGCIIVVLVALSDMPPVMVLAIFGVFLLIVPLILTARFLLKGQAVHDYIQRLEKKLPKEKGFVHWERLEFGRLEVWNVPFIGHRTGFTARTAIAVELMLQDGKELSYENMMQSFSPEIEGSTGRGTLIGGGIMNKSSIITMESSSKNIRRDVLDEQVRIQRVTSFLKEINLGRLSAAVRRNKLTFEKIIKLTDADWRTIGIDKTEVKLIKSNVQRFLEDERRILRDEQIAQDVEAEKIR